MNKDKNKTSLKFLGAANTVTGSRYLLRDAKGSLLVDCGLFQGYKYLREKNWQPFPEAPSSIDAVVLTHAHLDHSGYLPVLVANGFKGPIYCNEATAALCEILLLDAAHIQEEEAFFRNKHQSSKHKPALPLYTQKQARAALQQFQPVRDGEQVTLPNGKIRFHYNGHILGATFLEIEFSGRRLLFSGDVGRPHDIIMKSPESPVACDYLIVESTYGDRRHSSVDTFAALADIIRETTNRGGSVLIPAFAVGRAQAVLYVLQQLRKRGDIPFLPIYLDSPMAINTTELFVKHCRLHKLTRDECQQLCRDVNFTRTVEQSIALNHLQMPAIIISASGMATGGRVLHHLKRMLPNHRDSVVFAGFQAGGTRGARLLKGESEIKIHGHFYPVKAQIHSLDHLSAHADYEELTEWLRKLPVQPKQVFITHGEPEAADHFRLHLQEQLGWQAAVPEEGYELQL